MTRIITEKKNDFSVLKYELSVKTYQYRFHYFRCHSRFRIRKIVNISWAWWILQFLKTAWEFILPDDNGWLTFCSAVWKKKQVNCCFPFLTNPLLGRALKTARFVDIPNDFQWIAFNQFIYPLHPGSNRFCRHVVSLANNITFFFWSMLFSSNLAKHPRPWNHQSHCSEVALLLPSPSL